MIEKIAHFFRTYRIETIIFLSSFIIRLTIFLVLFYIYGQDVLSFANSDALGYIENGKYLVAGQGFLENGIPSALRTPIYPLFIATHIFLKIPLLFIPITQFVIFSAAAILLYKLGKLIFSDRAGKIAAFVFLLEPFMVVNSSILTPEVLFLFFLILTIYLFFLARNSDNTKLFFLSGVSLGLTILAKPVALYLPAVMVLFLLAEAFLRKERRRIVAIFIFLLAFLATVSPWSLRQYLTFGSWNLTNSETYMLYVRIVPIAVAEEKGISYEEASRILLKEELPKKIPNFDPLLMEYTFEYDEFLREDAKERLSQHTGALLKFYALSLTSGLFGTGYDYILEDFGLDRNYTRVSFTQKLANGDLGGFLKSFFVMDVFQSVVMAGGLAWLFLYSLIFLGLFLGIREKKTRPAVLFIIILALYFVFFSLGPQARARYRVPSYPFIFLLGAYSIDVLRHKMSVWASTLKLDKKHGWIFDFIDYSRSRVVSGIVGTMALFIFADMLGYNAWLVNLAWIPISFVISFSLIRVYAKSQDKSMTGKLKRMLIKEE